MPIWSCRYPWYDIRDSLVQDEPGGIIMKQRDRGGALYMADGRYIERWPGETDAHAIERNNQDWRPMVLP